MEKEFNLSDHVWGHDYPDHFVININDVKEFIRLLKEEIKNWEYQQEAFDELMKIIDKLAGVKLLSKEKLVNKENLR